MAAYPLIVKCDNINGFKALTHVKTVPKMKIFGTVEPVLPSSLPVIPLNVYIAILFYLSTGPGVSCMNGIY